mgnify:CR=1 FL=1
MTRTNIRNREKYETSGKRKICVYNCNKSVLEIPFKAVIMSKRPKVNSEKQTHGRAGGRTDIAT